MRILLLFLLFPFFSLTNSAIYGKRSMKVSRSTEDNYIEDTRQQGVYYQQPQQYYYTYSQPE